MRPRHQYRGFTVVEFVSVIIILGVLAGYAAPRFVDLANDAHRVVVAQTAAAFDTAIRQANIGCVIRGYAGKDNLPGFGDGNVDFNADCFPSSTNGNNSSNMNNQRCMQVWNGVLAMAPSISVPADDTTDWRAQDGGDPTCTYTYRRDTDDLRSFNYDSSSGLITVVFNP